MADYDWFDRHEPTEAEKAAAKWRPQGFVAVWGYRTNSSLRKDIILHYECRRGCGTLVHNPTEHMKNVCTEWEPVAGG